MRHDCIIHVGMFAGWPAKLYIPINCGPRPSVLTLQVERQFSIMVSFIVVCIARASVTTLVMGHLLLPPWRSSGTRKMYVIGTWVDIKKGSTLFTASYNRNFLASFSNISFMSHSRRNYRCIYQDIYWYILHNVDKWYAYSILKGTLF